MPLNKHIILGVHITDRAKRVDPVQHLFTEYGCSIRTRIGLHDTGETFCSPNGLIILEMTDDDAKVNELSDKLGKIEGVEVKKMVFDHP
jgi:hypothetical protein